LRQRHALTRQSGQLLPETPAVLAYASILNHGYSFDPDAAGGKPKAAAGLPSNNLAWYPLFPLLASGVQMMTGVAAPTALAITARLCALLGAVVFFACARRHYFNRLPALEPTENLHVTLRWDLAPADTAALWATALLLFNPFSIFLYEPGADSLFVLLFASFLLLIQ